MTRLFIRFYLGVLFILIAAGFVQSFVFRQRAEEQNVRVVEQALAGGLRAVRDRLEAVDEAQRPATLAEIQTDFAYPVEIVDIDSGPFSEAERGRLQDFDQVVLYVHRGARVATSLSNRRHAVSFGPLPSFVGPSQTELLAGLGVVLLVAAVAIAFLLRPVARQLRAVERTATAIAEGELSARIDASKVPKGQQLAHAFNTMADRTETLLRTQRELLQAVSHELRTPLARMRFAIDLIGSAKTDDERQARLESLDAATEELDELVAELLRYVRLETTVSRLKIQPIELLKTVNDLVEKQATIHPNVKFDLHDLESHKMIVQADESGLQRALGNLISNACRYANRRIRVTATELDDRVAIDVEDDGIGISVSDRERVIQPFVRLEDSGESQNGRGVGLGLALVNRIVTSHGGAIQIDDSELGGCRVRTLWPM